MAERVLQIIDHYDSGYRLVWADSFEDSIVVEPLMNRANQFLTIKAATFYANMRFPGVAVKRVR